MNVKKVSRIVMTVLLAACFANAATLKVPLPSKDKSTPVQQLNREGVEALRKNQFEKAKALFYRAYLYDPDDPFTLNNLGYISELEGQVDRAQKFYELAGQGPTEAVIAKSNVPSVEGKTVTEVAGKVEDKTILVNRQNVEAIRLISQGRAPEAELLLRGTLALQPGNAFTLNNYAVANEMEGDYDKAMQYYTAAAKSGSSETVIVTLDRSMRGKLVTDMAADSAKRLRERMRREQSLTAQVGRLNLQGVSALNRNALYDARQYFEKAYKLDPNNAFVLNNRGFLAEMDGDAESARYFYDKARGSGNANTRVGYATRQGAEGKKLFEIAADNDQKMDTEMTAKQDARRRGAGTPQLRRRDNSIVQPPVQAPAPEPQAPPMIQETRPLGPPQPPVPQLTPRPTPDEERQAQPQ